MRFIRKDKYYSQSENGYTVSASYNGAAWQFTAWFKNELIDVYNESEKAYTACENHLKKTNNND